MAVSLLAGFPVVASKAHNSTMTLTSPSHSVSGACLMVLVLATENANNSISNVAITDNTGGVIGTWTRQLQKRWDSGTGFTDFGWLEIYTAPVSGAYTSKTVTMTVTSITNTMMAAMGLYACTGYDTGTPIGASNGGQATADGSSHLIAAALTAQTTGGMVFGAGLNGNSELTLSAQSGTTIDAQVGDASAGTAIVAFSKTATTTASNAYTVGTTKTDQYYLYGAIEIRAGSSAVTMSGAATLAGMTGAATIGAGASMSASATLANMTGAAQASQVVTSGAATLAGMTGTASVAHGATASASATLAGMAGAATVGHGTAASASSTLAGMTGAATLSHGLTPTLSGTVTLAGMTGAASVGAGAVFSASAVLAGTQGAAQLFLQATMAGSTTFAGMTGAASMQSGESADLPYTLGGSTGVEILSPTSLTVELA